MPGAGAAGTGPGPLGEPEGGDGEVALVAGPDQLRAARQRGVEEAGLGAIGDPQELRAVLGHARDARSSRRPRRCRRARSVRAQASITFVSAASAPPGMVLVALARVVVASPISGSSFSPQAASASAASTASASDQRA